MPSRHGDPESPGQSPYFSGGAPGASPHSRHCEADFFHIDF